MDMIVIYQRYNVTVSAVVYSVENVITKLH